MGNLPGVTMLRGRVRIQSLICLAPKGSPSLALSSGQLVSLWRGERNGCNARVGRPEHPCDLLLILSGDGTEGQCSSDHSVQSTLGRCRILATRPGHWLLARSAVGTPAWGPQQGEESMPKKVLADTSPGQHCPLQGTLGWLGQGLTLQLSALAKHGEGMEVPCWPFPNIDLLVTILSLRGQREFYQL